MYIACIHRIACEHGFRSICGPLVTKLQDTAKQFQSWLKIPWQTSVYPTEDEPLRAIQEVRASRTVDEYPDSFAARKRPFQRSEEMKWLHSCMHVGKYKVLIRRVSIDVVHSWIIYHFEHHCIDYLQCMCVPKRSYASCKLQRIRTKNTLTISSP